MNDYAAEIRRLKQKNKVLKLVAVISFFILCALIYKRVVSPRPNGSISKNTVTVTTKSGVNIRTNPDVKSKVVGTAKFSEQIEVIEKNAKADSLDAKVDYWHKVKRGNETGFVWGGSFNTSAFDKILTDSTLQP